MVQRELGKMTVGRCGSSPVVLVLISSFAQHKTLLTSSLYNSMLQLWLDGHLL
jgi:hypothetical protein